MTEILHRRTRLENTTLNRGCGGRSHNRIVQYARAGAGFLPSTVCPHEVKFDTIFDAPHVGEFGPSVKFRIKMEVPKSQSKFRSAVP